MEGGLLRDKKLGNLWDDLVLAGGGRRLTGSTAVEQRSQAGTSSKGLDEGDSQWAPNETTSGSKKKTDAASKEEENEKANSRSGLSDEEKETDESAGSGVGEEAVAKDEDGAAASGESSESSSEKDSDDDDEAEEEGEEEEDAEVDEEVDLSKAGNWVLDLVSQKGINRRVRDLYIVLEERFPTSDLPAPPLSDQLQRLPPDIPLFVSHGAAPILASVGGQLGLNIREESATSMREGSLMHEFSAILSAPGSWLLFDIADIVDFEELAEVLELMPKGGLKKPSKNQARMRFLTASYSVSPGQVSAGAILNLLGLDEEAAGKGKEPSRLILYSSTETTQVPRHLLHSCLCVQSTVSFFGIRAAPEPDGSESEDSEDWENLESGKASRVESQDSEDRIGGGLRAKEFPQGADWLNLIGHDAPRLTHEVFGYLAYTHPLLTACPTATRGHRFMAVMSGIAGDLNNAGGKKLRLALKCKPEDVPEWLEENVVSRAQCWAHRSAICAMLQSFSPSLVRRSDGEVRETLGVVSGKLCGFLQRVNAAANVLTLDSPFWLRLELHRAASGIQAARADIMACYSALVGDVCWNQHLFAVYMSSSHGRAFWASGRPLAAWLVTVSGR
ncbi:unnamed protein product [Polarella glacialis]|uniref:Uncharacterized protein n=1 Tax=Polarella glacialis TaxID=89957 RepID=A0A813HTB2_POLGL|nr:unnamed protein product [Polarella glacialis]